MSQPLRVSNNAWTTRLREAAGRRFVGIVLTICVEALLIYALLTLGTSMQHRKEVETALVTFDAQAIPAPPENPPEQPAEEKAKEAQKVPKTAPPPATPPVPRPPGPPRPVVAPPVVLSPPWIEISREQLAVADSVVKAPPSPQPAPDTRAAVMGPVNTGSRGDSARVAGSGPNGEPLYAASWYREPYPDELRGYLSTARGPGWGLIACRTVAGYRVEDCVALDESPQGSNIARAVLGAAWQFRVRPPQLGGKPKIGEWVRIRIDYGTRKQ